jgi:hypothetical protein
MSLSNGMKYHLQRCEICGWRGAIKGGGHTVELPWAGGMIKRVVEAETVWAEINLWDSCYDAKPFCI